MFHSIKDAWLSAAKHNMADVKELIPEFYYLPEFLLNDNNFDLGEYMICYQINNNNEGFVQCCCCRCRGQIIKFLKLNVCDDHVMTAVMTGSHITGEGKYCDVSLHEERPP